SVVSETSATSAASVPSGDDVSVSSSLPPQPQRCSATSAATTIATDRDWVAARILLAGQVGRRALVGDDGAAGVDAEAAVALGAVCVGAAERGADHLVVAQ